MGQRFEQKKWAFVEQVGLICGSAGGVRVKDRAEITWELQTRAGPLHVSPRNNDAAPWIACYFLEPTRARLIVEDMEAYNGRWHFHLWSDWERTESGGWSPAVSKGLDFFESRLRAICHETTA